jgi:hypothetical protein
VDGEVSLCRSPSKLARTRARSGDLLGQALQYGHDLGTASRVIKSAEPDSRPMKSCLTRYFGSSRADDHGIRMACLSHSCHLGVRITRTLRK